MEPLFDVPDDVPAEDSSRGADPTLGWPTYITGVVAGQVRHWRRVRGLSAQQLSDKTRQLGHQIPRSVIANLEVGRRGTVGIAELLILAAALDVPPTMLITAVGQEERVEILPGIEETTWRARGWVLGALAPNYSTFSSRSWQGGRRAIELYDIHRLLVNECQQTLRRIRRLAGDRELDVSDFPLLEGTTTLQRTTLAETVEELVYSVGQLRTHRGHIQSEGYKLPEVPRSLAAMLRETDSGGRHHRQEPEVVPRDKGQSGDEKLLPPVIYDLMQAMHDEPRQGGSGSD